MVKTLTIKTEGYYKKDFQTFIYLLIHEDTLVL